MPNYNSAREKVYLPQVDVSLPKHSDDESTSKSPNGIKTPKFPNSNLTERSISQSFSDYLESWRKKAENFDVSEALTSAVESVKAFPEDSFAFCVGAGELVKLASSEMVEASREFGDLVEKEGVVDGFKIFVKERNNYFFIRLEPVYKKMSEAVVAASRYVLGEDNHKALGSLFDKYVAPIGSYLIEQLSRFFQNDAVVQNEHQNEYKNSSTFSSIDLGASQNNEKVQSRQEFLGELINRASDFLSKNKDFFAHSILDQDGDGVSALTPEILVEGDARSQPIYDPLPPAWVVAEKHKAQDEMNEYKRAYGENAPTDLQSGEITNLAKINLLTKSKIS